MKDYNDRMKDVLVGTKPWWADLMIKWTAPFVIVGFVVYITMMGMSDNAAKAAASSSEAVNILKAHQSSAETIAYLEWVKCIRASKDERDRVICGPDPSKKEPH